MFAIQEVAQMFDVVDVIFNFSGVITGYAVSPDSRFESCCSHCTCITHGVSSGSSMSTSGPGLAMLASWTRMTRPRWRCAQRGW